MEYHDYVKISTASGEIFYINEEGFVDWDLYEKERPELIPSTSEEYIYNRINVMGVSRKVTKQLYLDKYECLSHPFDYFCGASFPELKHKFYHRFIFCKNLYYIRPDLFEEYKKKPDFIYVDKFEFNNNGEHCVKISDGVYRDFSKEYFVFIDNKNIYIVNSDSLHAWEAYRNKFLLSNHLSIKNIFTLNLYKEKWLRSDYFQNIYFESERIAIAPGLYKVRNIIPDKIDNKYKSGSKWYPKYFTVDNQNNYESQNPEFYIFKDLSDMEYLVNSLYLDKWLSISKDISQTFSFFQKKFLYTIQPYEYIYIEEGIYKRNN